MKCLLEERLKKLRSLEKQREAIQREIDTTEDKPLTPSTQRAIEYLQIKLDSIDRKIDRLG